MSQITLKALARNFAWGPVFWVPNGWRPKPVAIYQTVPAGADVIAAPMPTKGGMRVIVYNRETFLVEVTVDSEV